MRNAAGEVIGASKIARDITERKRSEAWRTGQIEAFQAAINGAPLEVSLGILIRTTVEQADGEVRRAFYLADSEGRTIRHVVGTPGTAEICAEFVDGFGVGPDSLACGLAAYTGQPVITADVAQDPRWKPWRHLADKFDFRGIWSFPLQSCAGKVVGTFALYHRQPRQPQQRDRELAAALTATRAPRSPSTSSGVNPHR